MLRSVDNAQLIVVSYYTNMLSTEDTNNMLNVTMPDQIWICSSKQILQWFTFQIRILVPVDNTKQIFLSYYNNLLSSTDSNNMLNVTIPNQIWICGSKPILQSFIMQIRILVSVDNAQLIFVSYYKHMLSSKDTTTMFGVTIPNQIRICGSKLLRQSFT